MTRSIVPRICVLLQKRSSRLVCTADEGTALVDMRMGLGCSPLAAPLPHCTHTHCQHAMLRTSLLQASGRQGAGDLSFHAGRGPKDSVLSSTWTQPLGAVRHGCGNRRQASHVLIFRPAKDHSWRWPRPLQLRRPSLEKTLGVTTSGGVFLYRGASDGRRLLHTPA